MPLLSIDDSGRYGPSVVFSCGELPADEAIAAAGHEPNGYFWAGVATYLVPDVVAALDVDCEAGTFAAYGDPEPLEKLVAALDPIVTDGAAATAVIARAEAAGVSLDD